MIDIYIKHITYKKKRFVLVYYVHTRPTWSYEYSYVFYLKYIYLHLHRHWNLQYLYINSI